MKSGYLEEFMAIESLFVLSYIAESENYVRKLFTVEYFLRVQLRQSYAGSEENLVALVEYAVKYSQHCLKDRNSSRVRKSKEEKQDVRIQWSFRIIVDEPSALRLIDTPEEECTLHKLSVAID